MCWWCGAPARAFRCMSRVTAGTTDLVAQQPTTCQPEVMDAEDPLFILYTSGSTGQPKGVLHTSGGYLVYAAFTHRDGVRSARRGHLLVDRGHRLGHRTQLHRLRPARQRRDHRHVRRRAELSRLRPLLAGRRQAPGDDPVFIADRDPLAHARGREARESLVAQVAAPARLGRRADQSGGVGMVPPRRRRSSLPHRRHLVANGDRRNTDQRRCRARST